MAVALFLSPLGIASCGADEVPSVPFQEIRVTLVPETHLLMGESTVTVIPRGARQVSFRLSPAANVMRTSLGGKEVPFRFSAGLLTVDLPRGDGGKRVRITVGYRCRFNDPVPVQATTFEDPSYGVSGAISSRGVFLGSDAGWYPEPVATPAGRMITISAPAGIEAVTAGRRLAGKTARGVTTSTWEVANPVTPLSLSAGPYRIAEKKLGTLPVYTFFYPENAPLADRYLDAAVAYIRFYEGLLGPYPFEKFAVVENFFPTGYGFPSYTLIGGAIIRLPFIVGTSLPHEILHSWWGNGVPVDYGGGNWSEGLVTYLADHFLEEKKSPEAGKEYRLKLLTDYASLVTPEKEFPLGRFTGRSDQVSRSIGYGKGAMVFHMVRTMIGDEAFFEALRVVYRERLFRSASWSDFTRAFSRVSGKDLTPFMEQWLTRSGGPRLALKEVKEIVDGGKRQVRGTIVQSPPYYAVTVNLRLETDGGDLRQTVAVNGARTAFLFTTPQTPRRLFLDPDADLFRILSPRELPPSVNRIKGARRLLVVVSKGCQAREETLRLLLKSLGQAGATTVHEEELTAESLTGRDLLFCGVPERKGVLPPFPGGVSISPRGFVVDRHPFHNPDDLLFAVTGHRSHPERVVALFLPLSPTAAEKAALKITHYGKYGYLAFTAGENRGKGMFPPVDGESVVTFGGDHHE